MGPRLARRVEAEVRIPEWWMRTCKAPGVCNTGSYSLALNLDLDLTLNHLLNPNLSLALTLLSSHLALD